jgi:hypothetical protein
MYAAYVWLLRIVGSDVCSIRLVAEIFDLVHTQLTRAPGLVC